MLPRLGAISSIERRIIRQASDHDPGGLPNLPLMMPVHAVPLVIRRYVAHDHCKSDNLAQCGNLRNLAIKVRYLEMMGQRVTKKLADEVQRIALMIPVDLVKKINVWRGRQGDVPSLSEGVRRLLEKGLAADHDAAKGRKPK